MWRLLILVAVCAAFGCDGPKGKTASQIQAESEQSSILEDFSAMGVEMFPSKNALATDDAPSESVVATASAEGVTLDAFRVTKEPAKEVAIFYMSRLTEPVETEAGGVIAIEGISKEGDRVRVTASEKDGQTAFTVSVKKQTAPEKTPPDSP
jgi:hypothetical protein